MLLLHKIIPRNNLPSSPIHGELPQLNTNQHPFYKALLFGLNWDCVIFAVLNFITLTTTIEAPKAKRIPKALSLHGDTRTDYYYWMNQREDPEVKNFLAAENAYYRQLTAHTRPLQSALFAEMKSRIKLDDESVPYLLNGYWYYIRYTTGSSYPLYCRKKESLQAAEELLFNGDQMAKGHDFFSLGGINISPHNDLATFGVDTLSRRNYTLQVKNLKTGEVYPDKIENTTGRAAWANDNQTFFYTKKNVQTLRAYQIYKHTLGEDPKEDQLIYEEQDEKFSCTVYRSKSRQFLILSSGSTSSDEYRILNADHPDQDFVLFQKRVPKLEYSIAHYGDFFYILTNKDKADNFKLMKTPLAQTTLEHWEEVIPHRKDVLLEDVDIFKDFLVLTERVTGLSKIRVLNWEGNKDYYIPFESQTYTAATGHNPEFDTPVLRYVFNEMTSPSQVIDYNMETHQAQVVKEQEVMDPQFDKTNYYAKRVWAKAQDGTRIPISLVYRKGIKMDGSNPLLLYGYGSYGITVDPSFSTTRLSLLDRGFIYAIAHVRGGEYLGRKWYEKGKLLHKMNTFTDFISCSQYLIQQRYTSSDHLYAMGGSAGGMLMGGIVNMAPQLYHGVIAEVPFVDVLTTMLDDSIPLTVGEYEEWGNPNKKEEYTTIKAYSPYDNVKKQAYPHLLITTGFHDSQVQYWEPAKWVAKLREVKTDTNKLLFHINMEAGHGGASGRFEALKEIAEDYAFLLDLEGITN